MAKKRHRKHRVTASVQVGSLTKAGTSIDLEIFAENEKIGTLVIGRGSISWYGKQWKKGRKWSWSQFAYFMDNA